MRKEDYAFMAYKLITDGDYDIDQILKCLRRDGFIDDSEEWIESEDEFLNEKI